MEGPRGSKTGFEIWRKSGKANTQIFIDEEDELSDAEREFLAFQRWVDVRFKSVVALWHRLDRDKSMLITRREFFDGLKAAGYKGDADKLWKLIDRDTTGNISFLEFAPAAALQLSRFQLWTNTNFGSAQKLFGLLDADRSGELSFKEFASGCKAQGLPEDLQEALKTLFRLFDSDDGTKKGGVSKDEFAFLDRWKTPPYLFAEPDFEAMHRFKDALMHRHGENALAAWRKTLDKDSSMRVSYEEFVIQCQALARMGVQEANPPGGILGIYVAIDSDRSGWFSLKEWDPDVYDWLITFVHYCRKECKTCAGFLKRCLEASESVLQGVDFRQFSRALAPSGLTPSQRLALFEGLQAPTKKYINDRLFPADLVFLMPWDPEQEAADEKLWGNWLNSHPMIDDAGGD